MNTTKISVVMPVYNVEAFVQQAIESVLAQTFENFELLIVNDCATDNSLAICKQFEDSRIRIINHEVNQGLAAARNTGIRHALGDLVAFIDSDDMWHPHKLALHAKHLADNPQVGISFSRSCFMSFEGKLLDFYQMPQLTQINAAHLLCRNPVGNGSAPVIRRQTLNDIRYQSNTHSQPHSCYFDERFRQSEDIECWLRIVATTDWQMEGIPEPLTYYRLNHGGLSSNLYKQLDSWEQMIRKARVYAPALLAKHENQARGYQLRYLARQAIRLADGHAAKKLVNNALMESPSILFQETSRTLVTLSAAYLLWALPLGMYKACERLGQKWVSSLQKVKIYIDGVPTSFTH
ncbi:glycosyltransferase family 2 protein [Shewanella gelidii]|uniref:Glycosyltransferase 2-like domain-containing protein n=1 Tax=Shewanella gelidii TaxID=1642821 RepID=A0A917N606_9GAMM|nr:glycosyltransferase family 2 protein [Shewanella gelidii]MCL1096407.1 glycosyltransferase [Shewanella gelidii]GGI67218.1 hypothetical protein GCM10009332_00350 [Shewanella gelidii]